MSRVIEYQVAILHTDDGPVLSVGEQHPVSGPTEAELLADLPRHLLAAHLDGVPMLVGDDPPAEALASATVAVFEHEARPGATINVCCSNDLGRDPGQAAWGFSSRRPSPAGRRRGASAARVAR